MRTCPQSAAEILLTRHDDAQVIRLTGESGSSYLLSEDLWQRFTEAYDLFLTCCGLTKAARRSASR